MQKENVRIVFMGTPDFASHILRGLFNEDYNIIAAVTQPDKPTGRHKTLTPSAVSECAAELGIPVIKPVKIRNEYEDVLAYKPDLIITSAYGQIIPKVLLDYPKYKCINTHGSLLPKYRGGAPIQQAIIDGEKQTGMTIMYMNEKMDEGDILCQQAIDIDIHDTNTTLFAKMSELALRMLISFLPDFLDGRIDPIKQDETKATYAYNLSKEIEYIHFNDDVKRVYDHIRGLQDNPGCFFTINEKKYKLGRCFFTYADDTDAGVFKGLEKDYLRLDCDNGFIMVYEIKPEGKNLMDAKAFYNGSGRLLTGEKLG